MVSHETFVRVTWLAATLGLYCVQGWAGQVCTIVTNGTIEIYEHELAHCNGWKHEPFSRVIEPPAEYVHPYAGTLTIIMSGHDDWLTRTDPTLIGVGYAIKVTSRPVAQLCAKLWREHGISEEVYAMYLNDILGCSVKD